jgi:hypothetical protein
MYNYILKKESIFVAGLTAALYAAVYFYERGGASELNIPLDLITLSIPTISNDIMKICLFSFPLLTISTALLIWAKDNKQKRAAAHLGISGVYVAGAYSMLSIPLDILLLFVFNALVLLHLLSQWIPIHVEKKNDSFDGGNIREFGIQTLNVAAVAFFFSLTFIGLGRSSVHGNEFTVFIMNNKEYAIAKVYDENVFTWNVANGKVIHQLTYFRMENINGLEFKQKKLKNDIKTK